MIEGHEFVDGYYLNNDRTIVETVWWSEKENTNRTQVVKVDDNNVHLIKLKAFLEEQHSLEFLDIRTVHRIREQRELYERQILMLAKGSQEWDHIVEDNKLKNYDQFHSYLNSEDEKEVFQLKLKFFDEENVAQSNDRKLKAELRKAKTIKDVLIAYFKF